TVRVTRYFNDHVPGLAAHRRDKPPTRIVLDLLHSCGLVQSRSDDPKPRYLWPWCGDLVHGGAARDHLGEPALAGHAEQLRRQRVGQVGADENHVTADPRKRGGEV